MSVIESSEYSAEVAELQADSIVCALAVELYHAPVGVVAGFTNNDGSPKFEFMQLANRVYAQRGGTKSKSIGGVAKAILANIDELAAMGVKR